MCDERLEKAGISQTLRDRRSPMFRVEINLGFDYRAQTPRTDRDTGAFTLVELMVVIAVIALTVCLLLPSLNAARQSGRRVRSLCQIRSVHQNMLGFAAGNGQFYPGFDSHGQLTDSTVEGRHSLLIGSNFILARELISPCESQALKPFIGGASGLTTSNYSYALPVVFIPDATGGRQEEAGLTANPGAVAICDRAIKNGGSDDAGFEIRSIHTTPAAGVTEWRGNVCWNDNHAAYLNNEYAETQYGVINASDNLFATPGDVVRCDQLPGGAENQSDALMTYYGALSGLGQ
jgi:prepilin-type N-terminal cleavage/methylation domain-containing protein